MDKTTLESAAFIVSPTQVALDTAMLQYDIWGTLAHLLMLHSTGIVPPDAAVAICSALDGVERAVREGDFRIDPGRGPRLSLAHPRPHAAGRRALTPTPIPS